MKSRTFDIRLNSAVKCLSAALMIEVPEPIRKKLQRNYHLIKIIHYDLHTNFITNVNIKMPIRFLWIVYQYIRHFDKFRT